MTPSAHLPRLALARPAQHPLADTVLKAGWLPVPYAFTSLKKTGATPPMPLDQAKALLVLSPSGAQVAAAILPAGMTCLVQGAGTADALGREDLDVHLPSEARAEALWELLQERFPGGGEFVLVRGERSREYLEVATRGFRLAHPRLGHPLRGGPGALSTPAGGRGGPGPEPDAGRNPRAPDSGDVQRFAWGEAAAEAFARAGAPAHAHCEPKPSLLWAMLAQHLSSQENP